MPRQVRELIGFVLAALLGACAAAQTQPRTPLWETDASEFRATARLLGIARAAMPARIEVTVETRAGFHLNDDYPHRFTAAPAASIDYALLSTDVAGLVAEPCAGDNAHHCRIHLAVTFTPRAPGPRSVGGELAFGACDAERCIIAKLPIALSIDVQPAL